MSVNSVDYTSSQSIGSLVLQQLMGEESASESSSNLSGILDDLVSISSTGQKLSQAPDAVVQAMADLFSGQEDVQGDISLLKSYFQENPDGLANVLTTMENGTSTYDALGKLSSSSDNSALLKALLGSQSQNSLLDYLGDSASGSSSSGFSLLG